MINEIIKESSVNKHNIVTQTYRNMNKYMFNAMCNYFQRCENNQCIICKVCKSGTLMAKELRSKATEENYKKAIKKE